MKRPHLLLIILAVYFLSPRASSAQVGTMKWHFRTRDEVIPALKKTRGNLRKTYEVLVCAGRQGFCNTSIAYYEAVVGHEFDVSWQDSAAYAFAFDIGYSFRPWSWKIDPNQQLVKKSSRATAQYFRDRAYKIRPLSPEVLVMRAFWGSTLTKNEVKVAYKQALQAVKLAPNWADGYYWLGLVTGNYGNTFNHDKSASGKAARIHAGRLEMRAYDKAEKLDPALRPYLYLGRIDACELIADKKSATMIPRYLDAHLRAFPKYAAWFEKAWSKDEAELRKMYADEAADIAKKATS